ncbi:MAG TPA: hypothetical protein ENH95_02920 [Nitrosopumilus sp.]|nr:hypothetical protein [Nitrosopumilus sp.]
METITSPVFHKYPKIKIIGDEENAELLVSPNDTIYLEEKIDGANFRFMKTENGILFGSRSNELGYGVEEAEKNWKRCIRFILEKVPKEDSFNIKPGIIFYGECCVKHSFDYDWDKIPPYLGFDIMNEERFYDGPAKTNIFKAINLPIVPLIEIKKAKEITGPFNDAMVPQSHYSKSQAEGMVFKNYEKQIFAKYVTTKFKEVNKNVFGTPKRYSETDADRIVAMYCTNPRIDKQIFKLVDEGKKLEMALMKELPKRILEDIYAENWREILYSNFKLDMKRVRSKVAIRCKNVLQQIITNNALSERSVELNEKRKIYKIQRGRKADTE